nr:tRNA pseudouridine(13) synthase TruD [Acidianus sulfidivorans]
MKYIDYIIGIESHYYDWDTINVEIPRPEGFNVIEEISYKPCDEWKGNTTGKYAVYLLEKKNVDHFYAMSVLNKVLKKKIHYIGIKDTNALTKQIVYTNGPTDIQEYENDGIKLSFVGYSNSKFDHTGNIFHIYLDTDSIDEIENRVKVISKNPYLPAFIGYQRFGTRRPITHVIGYYLTQRDWYNAVMSILSFPFYTESEVVRKARKLILENNYEEALEILPKKFNQERIILRNLIKTGNYYYALKSSFIPLSFYVEAYQSYLFNKLLSRVMKNIQDMENTYLGIYSNIDKCSQECKDIYKEENIGEGAFRIEELKINKPQLVRKAFMKIRNLRLNKNNLTFALDRGMYATVFLVELLNIDARKIT